MCNCQTTKAIVKWEGSFRVFFTGKDRLGILVQKMVLVSHTCCLFFLLPSLSFSLSVVYSVLIKMSPNNFIYMIVACFCVCVCLCVRFAFANGPLPTSFSGSGSKGGCHVGRGLGLAYIFSLFRQGC